MFKFINRDGQKFKVEQKQIQLDPLYTEEHGLKLIYLNNTTLLQEEGIQLKTPYLSSEVAQDYLISIDENGKFVDKNGIALDDGSYLVVMTGEYNSVNSSLENVLIYASRDKTHESKYSVYSSLPSNLPWVVSHPNFIQGAPVVFSGYMTFYEGHIESATNNSGHYKPKMFQILPALAYILKAANAEVVLFDNFISNTRYSISADEKYKNFTVEKEDDDYVLDEDSENIPDSVLCNTNMDILPSNLNGYRESKPSITRVHSRPLPLKDLFFSSSGTVGNSDNSDRELQKTVNLLNISVFKSYACESRITRVIAIKELLRNFVQTLSNCKTVNDIRLEKRRFDEQSNPLNSQRIRFWSKARTRAAIEMVAEKGEQIKLR